MGGLCDGRELGEQIAAFVKRLYCKKCIGPSAEKRRHLNVEQTPEPPYSPLLPGPDEVEWKRIVRGQRRQVVVKSSRLKQRCRSNRRLLYKINS